MEPTSESLALLSRLSSKPGVQSTLVLSRIDGAILRSEGLLSRSARKRAPSQTQRGTENSRQDQSNGKEGGPRNADGNEEEDGEVSTGQDIARTVWRYIKATEGMVEEMDSDDELRLLRVRTKKNELVIVPSSKFLLVVIHDTPPA